MKKLIAMALFVAAGVAQAGGYGTVEYYDEHNRVSGADNIKGAVVIGNKVDGGMDYSLKMESSQAELGNGSISSGVEVRAKKTFDAVSGVNPYLGVRLGEKITSSTHFSHYAVDYGIKFPIVGALSGDLGARYRNAFESGHSFETNRVHGILAYALTKQDSVAVRWSRSYGDEEKDAWRLSYTRSF
jgi:hypothetical protein